MKYIFIIILLPLLAFSWKETGHMLVSAIAQARLLELNPAIHKKFRDLVLSINNLVDQRSQTFIEAASWPDDIKQYYNMTIWNHWHYFDQTYVSDGVVPVINFTEKSYQAVTLIEEAINVLTVNQQNICAERALFARYLVHVVGDIHQPLHGIALFNKSMETGDIGGNLLNVIRPTGQETNLHRYWDTGAYLFENQTYKHERPMDQQKQLSLMEIAAGLMTEYQSDILTSSNDLDPANWASEAYNLAKQIVYPLMFKTNKISKEYESTAYETCRRQVTLAGYRLANLVIDIFQGDAEKRKKENGHAKLKEKVKKQTKNIEQN